MEEVKMKMKNNVSAKILAVMTACVVASPLAAQPIQSFNAQANEGFKAINKSAIVLKASVQQKSQTDQYQLDGDLASAVFLGRVAKVQSLLAQGANANARFANGSYTVLMGAVSSFMDHRVEVINALLSGGADVNAKGIGGITALMVAVDRHSVNQSVNMDIIKTLLAHGADVTATADNGDTALSLAQSHGHTDVVALIKNANAAR